MGVRKRIEARGDPSLTELKNLAEKRAMEGRLWVGLAELLGQKQTVERQLTGAQGSIAAAEDRLERLKAQTDEVKAEQAGIIEKGEEKAAEIVKRAEAKLAEAEAKCAEADQVVDDAKATAAEIVARAKAEAAEVMAHIDALRVKAA